MDRSVSFKKALRLEYFTVGYNFFEAAASILVGRSANSIALIGFGLDSLIENASAFILIWRLKKGALSPGDENRIESRASRFVGVTFFILGLYIVIESVLKITGREKPEVSIPGIIIAALSLFVMPLLARAKFRLGRAMQLSSLMADSKETMVCALLSAALLIGLASNALFSIWLADPLVGLLIAAYLFIEGWDIFRDE